MILQRGFVFLPGFLAILYGSWLVLTAPPEGLADLAGIAVVSVGVLACVLAALFLIVNRYWVRWKMLWWRDLAIGVLTLLLSLGGIALFARA